MPVYISLKMRFPLRNPYNHQTCPHFNPLVSCKSYRFGKVIIPFLKIGTLRVTKSHVSLFPKKWAGNSKFRGLAHGLIVLLAKSKLNSIDFLISNALIESVVTYDELVVINNALKEYNKMKEKIKNLIKDLISL